MRVVSIAILGAAALVPVGAARAADLTVEFQGLRNAAGVIRVAVCPQDSFTKPACPHAATAPASAGRVVVAEVPPGVYAVQAFHDEDGDGELDRIGLRPAEGWAFSRDAPMRLGPPRFSDAAVRIGGDATVTLRMRYLQ
jgi:uncharacterized protein (DUF2141 family)